MTEELNKIKEDSFRELRSVSTEPDIYQFKSKYLGRNGSLTQIIKNLRNVPAEQRSSIGQIANKLKNDLSEAIEQALKESRQRVKTVVFQATDWM